MKAIKLLGTAVLTLASAAIINAQCTASGSVSLTGNLGEISIVNNSTTSGGGAYSWISFYNTTSSQNAGSLSLQPSTSTATYTFTDNGVYYYYLEVEDSISSCYDSIGGSFTISGLSGGSNCDANFSLYQDSINQGQYYAWNNSTGTGLTYSWDFGDGTTSSQAYPNHTYTNVGNYAICLTVADGGGCADTYCDTINVVVKAAGTSLNVLSPGQTVGVEEVTLMNEVSLYPNPSKGAFRLSVNVAESMSVLVNITNLTGQILEQTNVQLIQGENEVSFNQAQLSQGVYLVNVISEGAGEVSTLKLIKE